jgi:hypothetical protein
MPACPMKNEMPLIHCVNKDAIKRQQKPKWKTQGNFMSKPKPRLI